MVYGNNNPSKEQIQEINELVGKPYGLGQRLKMGGNGSPRLIVEHYSPQLKKHFGENLSRKFANIEIRERGILIYFRNNVNDYVWPIPYYHLTIYKSENWSVHSQGLFLRMELDKGGTRIKKFFRKLMDKRSDYMAYHSMPLEMY